MNEVTVVDLQNHSASSRYEGVDFVQVDFALTSQYSAKYALYGRKASGGWDKLISYSSAFSKGNIENAEVFSGAKRKKEG